MKKFLLALTVLMFAVIIFAEGRIGDNLMQTKWRGLFFDPYLISQTPEDYMNGGYNGFALRLQPKSLELDEESKGHHAVITYMFNKNPSVWSGRMQQRAALVADAPKTTGKYWIKDLTNNQAREGHGSLTICPETGIPFLSTHTWFDGTASFPEKSGNSNNNPNVLVVRETSNTSASDGWVNDFLSSSMTDQKFILRKNDLVNDEVSYQWPVLYTGASPVPASEGTGWRRLYVFTSNGGHMPYKKYSTSADGYPSSSELLSFADYNTNQFAVMPEGTGSEQLLANLRAWDPKENKWRDGWYSYEIPFFRKIHEYDNPSDDKLRAFVRAFPSYAVQEKGPGVAYAGNITCYPEIWEGTDILGKYDGEEFETFVLYSQNYGEPDSWEFFPININDKPILFEEYKKANPGAKGYGAYTFRGITNEYSDGFAEKDVTILHYLNFDKADQYGGGKGLENWGMFEASLNHKTVVFDKDGRIVFPNFHVWAHNHNDEDSTYYPAFYQHSVTVVSFDPKNEEITLASVHPINYTKIGTVADPPKLGVSFDWNLDGWVDEHNAIWVDQIKVHPGIVDLENYDPNEEYKLLDFYTTPVTPYPMELNTTTLSNDTSMRFHANQARLTIPGENGAVAMMWVDSAYATLLAYYEDAEQEMYRQTPQLMLALSLDSGKNWGEPLRMDKYTHPELFKRSNGEFYYPSFVYPGDRIDMLGAEAVVYFYLVNDKSYGIYSGSMGLGSSTEGADLYYCAVKVVVEGVGTTEETIPKPQAISLSQNYPNPFNPTTTIEFNLNKQGKVNLSVYNIKGQKVKTLVNDIRQSGKNTVVWNGVDDNNNPVASGVYFYKIEAAGSAEVKKMILIK